MIYHVEGGEQVQDSENGNLSLVSVAKKAVGDMKKSSLSTLMLAISRLFKFKRVFVGDVLNQLMENDSLKKRQVRHWTVIFQRILIKTRFSNSRVTSASFKHCGTEPVSRE